MEYEVRGMGIVANYQRVADRTICNLRLLRGAYRQEYVAALILIPSYAMEQKGKEEI
jgi:hypothetical protein